MINAETPRAAPCLQVISQSSRELIVKEVPNSQWASVFVSLLLMGGAFATYRSFSKPDTFVYFCLVVFVAGNLLFLIKPLKGLLLKEQYLFDLHNQVVVKNNQTATPLREVADVEVKKEREADAESEARYSLNLRLTDSSTLEIHNYLTATEAMRVANTIASFINKPINSTATIGA